MENQQMSDLQQAISKIEATQQKLIDFLSSGQDIQISNKEYMHCYDLLCKVNFNRQNREEIQLFEWFSKQMEQYLDNQFQRKIQVLTGEEYLEKVKEEWQNLQLYLFWLKFIFTKFDQSYKALHGQSLSGKTFTLLRERIFIRNKEIIYSIIFDFLNKHRDDLQVPFQLIVKIIQYFVELGFAENVQLVKYKEIQGFSKFGYNSQQGKEDLSYYREHFEQRLIDNAKEYWNKKSAQWLEDFSVPEFVKNAKYALDKEKERSQQCFKWSYKLYMDTCEKEIISNNAKELIGNKSSGLANMIKQDKYQEIQELYNLMNYRREDTISILSSELNSYIKTVGNDINSNEQLNKDSKEYIREVISFFKKIDGIIKDQLNKEQDIQTARDRGFREFLNKNDKYIFFLAKHCDQELRVGMKGNSEAEIDEKLQDIIDIFLCFDSRDSFITHYQKFLALRLLQGNTLSDENEKKLITLIKKEMGKSTTNKLTEMCTDMVVNQETMNEIKKKMKEIDSRRCDEIDWKITILTSGHWTIQKDILDVPNELIWIADTYIKLYKEKHKGRKIDWAFSQGNAEISTKFDKKYTLDVTNYQLLILLLFNKADSYTFKYISDVLKIPIQELHLNLITLCKYKLFNRDNNNDLTEFKDNEVISVNTKFSSKIVKIKMHPNPELRKALKNQEKTVNVNDNEIEGELKKLREHQLDACIVRIMKSRKTLALNELSAEIVKLIGHIFKPQPQQIKQRIESLIERDYLIRHVDDRTKFLYKP
ncbi:hypothetical protein ABPG74_014493 [Tetrahymena malaccensis]